MGKVQANEEEGEGGIGSKQNTKLIDSWEKYKKEKGKGERV
jgi:hypothetical protein